MFGNLIGMITEPLVASGVGTGYSYMTETNPTYQNLKSHAYNGAIIGGSYFISKMATNAVIPTFKNHKLFNLQQSLMGAVATGGLNVIAQKELNSDLRLYNNFVAGAIAGGIAPITSSYLSGMISS
jgi:hypothetical protein